MRTKANAMFLSCSFHRNNAPTQHQLKYYNLLRHPSFVWIDPGQHQRYDQKPKIKQTNQHTKSQKQQVKIANIMEFRING